MLLWSEHWTCLGIGGGSELEDASARLGHAQHEDRVQARYAAHVPTTCSRYKTDKGCCNGMQGRSTL